MVDVSGGEPSGARGGEKRASRVGVQGTFGAPGRGEGLDAGAGSRDAVQAEVARR